MPEPFVISSQQFKSSGKPSVKCNVKRVYIYKALTSKSIEVISWLNSREYQIKSFIVLLYFTETSNEFARPISASLRLWATQFSKKCWNDGESFATLCPIWTAQDLNLRPPAPKTNALPFDQLAGFANFLIQSGKIYYSSIPSLRV